jgi:transcriptional regulator with XRE-family HTH domain
MTDNIKTPDISENKDSKLSIGDRIQKKRKEHGLSVDELASLTASFDFSLADLNEKGLSSQTLYRYEKSEREPATREIRLLCSALNVSADWLIFGESWNGEQDADTKLANNFRALIKEGSDSSYSQLFNRNKSRNEMHYLKLTEVKNRSSK